jgi:uncharacterized protein YcbK (DUF882 family)
MQHPRLAGRTRSRRHFLAQSLAMTAGLCIAGEAPAAILKAGSDRTLAFHNLHTNESLKCRYWSNGGYDHAALEDINFLLRDFHTDEIKAIDTRLLDLLTLVRRRLNTRQPYQVISGYRSPKTNAMLRARSRGVAKHSLHMAGKAIDVCLPGVELATLRETGLALKLGGVGYYPRSGFVHLDAGRPRFW